eukprot:1139038-Pelagomonas_calceolata.AAC.1
MAKEKGKCACTELAFKGLVYDVEMRTLRSCFKDFLAPEIGAQASQITVERCFQALTHLLPFRLLVGIGVYCIS